MSAYDSRMVKLRESALNSMIGCQLPKLVPRSFGLTSMVYTGRMSVQAYKVEGRRLPYRGENLVPKDSTPILVLLYT
jgi:hypothetical protein